MPPMEEQWTCQSMTLEQHGPPHCITIHVLSYNEADLGRGQEALLPGL